MNHFYSKMCQFITWLFSNAQEREYDSKHLNHILRNNCKLQTANFYKYMVRWKSNINYFSFVSNMTQTSSLMVTTMGTFKLCYGLLSKTTITLTCKCQLHRDFPTSKGENCHAVNLHKQLNYAIVFMNFIFFFTCQLKSLLHQIIERFVDANTQKEKEENNAS